MAIATKTMYVADDNSYWSTEEEAEARNTELSNAAAEKKNGFLNAIQFANTTINTKLESFSIEAPTDYTVVADTTNLNNALLTNNVVKIRGSLANIVDLAEEYEVSDVLKVMIETASTTGNTVFFKVSGTWYSYTELISMGYEAINVFRNTAFL